MWAWAEDGIREQQKVREDVGPQARFLYEGLYENTRQGNIGAVDRRGRGHRCRRLRFGLHSGGRAGPSGCDGNAAGAESDIAGARAVGHCNGALTERAALPESDIVAGARAVGHCNGAGTERAALPANR